MYVSSDKIKFYPSAYRYYMDEGVSVVLDQEASKNTEFNLTSHLSKVFHLTNGSFIVSDDNDTDLEFYIGGYYAKVNNVATSLLASSDWASALNIYANVKTVLTTPSGGESWENLYEVVQFDDLYKPLDDKISAANIVFKGIKFGTAVDPNATFSLHLYTRASTSDSFTLVANNKYPLSLTAILGNPTNGKSASEEIKTASLLVTNTISGASATLTGTLTANKGVFSTVEVETNILPQTSGAAVLGSSNKKFDQLYTNKVYTTDVYTSYIEVGELKGPEGNNAIKLCNNLIPLDNYVSIGSSANRVRQIYAQDIYGYLDGTAETAEKLTNTDYGTAKTPVYISQGLPVASDWNTTLYNSITGKRMLRYTYSFYSPGNNVLAPWPMDYFPVGMYFLTVNFNGDRCTVVFSLGEEKTIPSYSTYYNTYASTYIYGKTWYLGVTRKNDAQRICLIQNGTAGTDTVETVVVFNFEKP